MWPYSPIIKYPSSSSNPWCRVHCLHHPMKFPPKGVTPMNSRKSLTFPPPTVILTLPQPFSPNPPAFSVPLHAPDLRQRLPQRLPVLLRRHHPEPLLRFPRQRQPQCRINHDAHTDVHARARLEVAERPIWIVGCEYVSERLSELVDGMGDLRGWGRYSLGGRKEGWGRALTAKETLF